VFDLVLLDDKNPRSVCFKSTSCSSISSGCRRNASQPARRSGAEFCNDCARAARTIRHARTGRIEKSDLPGSKVGRVIQQTLRDLPKLSDAIAASFLRAFGHLADGARHGRDMNYRIVHRTLYEYAAPVTVSHHVARLEPRAPPRSSAKIFAENFSRAGAPQGATDYFGNRLCFFSIQEIHQRWKSSPQPRDGDAQEMPAPEATPAWEEVANLFRDPVSPEVVEPYQFVLIRRRSARRWNWPITPAKVLARTRRCSPGARI
jgi:hypothetical protein